jgi:hypothetical protein
LRSGGGRRRRAHKKRYAMVVAYAVPGWKQGLRRIMGGRSGAQACEDIPESVGGDDKLVFVDLGLYSPRSMRCACAGRQIYRSFSGAAGLLPLLPPAPPSTSGDGQRSVSRAACHARCRCAVDGREKRPSPLVVACVVQELGMCGGTLRRR